MRLKPLLFRLAAIALPLVVLLLVEGGLRLAGVAGESRRVFSPIPDHPDHLALNPAYVARYFPSFQPAVAFDPFLADKPADAFRVFVLGGSSAAGFPYHAYYGFPERLRARLAAVAPGRRVEVVNLGMTAVNSYTLWDLAGAVAAARPDAVLIYAGHNEYYGAFGAGSTVYALGNQIWLKRLTLRLKRSVLFSLLEGLITGRPSGDDPAAARGEGPDGRTMMARVVRDATIVQGGPVYTAGLRQFESNLSDVLDAFAAAGVPVYLGTLTSNLQDQPPLGDDPAARAAFDRGRRLFAGGDTAAARAAFVEARARDDIRFRAPDEINDQIHAFAGRPGVVLVDVAERFASAAPGGIEGDALFDDHLHPNAGGYDLMAETFFEALRSHPALRALPAVEPDSPARVDPLERAYADLLVARLKGGYPFRKDVAPEAEAEAYRALLARYRDSGRYADSLAFVAFTTPETFQALLYEGVRRARAQADTLSALLMYRALLHWQPFNAPLMEQAVGYASASPGYDALVADMARFAAGRTGDVEQMHTAAALTLRQNRLAEAAGWLDAAEARDADSPILLYNKARLLLMQGDTLAARQYFERYRAARGNVE